MRRFIGKGIPFHLTTLLVATLSSPDTSAEVCHLGFQNPKNGRQWNRPIESGAKVLRCHTLRCHYGFLLCTHEEGETPLLEFDNREGAKDCQIAAQRLGSFLEDPFRSIIRYKGDTFTRSSFKEVVFYSYLGCQLPPSDRKFTNPDLYLATCEDFHAAVKEAERYEDEPSGLNFLKKLNCVENLPGRRGYAIYNLPRPEAMTQKTKSSKEIGVPHYGALRKMLDRPHTTTNHTSRPLVQKQERDETKRNPGGAANTPASNSPGRSSEPIH